MICQDLRPQDMPDLLDAVERITRLPSVLVSPVSQHQRPPGHFRSALRVTSPLTVLLCPSPVRTGVAAVQVALVLDTRGTFTVDHV